MRRSKWLGIGMFGLVMGCATAWESIAVGPPADLTDAKAVVDWANLANPLVMAMHALEPFQEPFAEVDPLAGDCPAVVPDGDGSLVLTGGCTDAAGRTWRGRARIEGFDPATADGLYRFDDFGHDARITGTSRFVTVDGVQHFWTDLVRAPGADDDGAMAFVYQGSSWADGAETVREGAGFVTIEGKGHVDAETVAQRRDPSQCEDESLGGFTRMAAGDHEVEIRYDGETDCDPESTVQWTLDGVDQGELAGVSCSHVGAAAGLWTLFPLLAMRRRR